MVGNIPIYNLRLTLIYSTLIYKMLGDYAVYIGFQKMHKKSLNIGYINPWKLSTAAEDADFSAEPAVLVDS